MVVKRHSQSMEKTTFQESQRSDTATLERNENGADPNCEYCCGDGEVIGDAYDPDSHQYMRGAGYPERCVCVVVDEETESDDY